MEKKIIHFSDWSGQPYIHLACADSDHITKPAWECTVESMLSAMDNSPYLTEEKDWYTFDMEEVTCEICKEKINERCIQNKADRKFSSGL